MTVKAVFANLSCSDLEKSAEWFGQVFRRAPDARPMQGLCEWHFGDTAGFQLYEDADKAGQGTLSLFVSDIRSDRERLSAAGLEAGEVEEADYVSICKLSDPDGNLVVLAQDRS